jgi:hypothetical protein
MPIARGLNGGRGMPTAGNALEKSCLISRASRPARCIYVEEATKKLGQGIIVAIGLTLPAFGQGVDPLLGTWKMNVEKSTSTGTLVKSAVNTYAKDGENIINTIEGIDAQGKPYKTTLQHIYDGMPHPSTGPYYDATAYTRIDNTINLIRFRQGKAVEVGQGVIVPGKTSTFTEKASPQPVSRTISLLSMTGNKATGFVAANFKVREKHYVPYNSMRRSRRGYLCHTGESG